MTRFLLVLCAAGLSGCFTSNVVVTVRPDGSGTVEQTATIRPADLLAFDRLASPDLAANAQNPADIANQFQKDVQKANQGWLVGGNLRLRSTRPINTGETIGWAVTYDFDDVTGMRLDLLPQIPGLQGFYGIAAKDAGASTRLTTTLEPIDERLQRLTFQFPRFAMDPAGEPPSAWASGSPREMLEFRKLLRGSRVSIAIESTASIIRTNSPFREQNRVTLLDIDIEQALFSRQMGMLASTPSTFRDLLFALADLPGVTLAHEEEITIDVENPSRRTAVQQTQPATTAPADTEIFLASLLLKDDKLALGPPVNITNSPGYDNQPSFTPDGNRILFASVRAGGGPSRDRSNVAGSGTPATDIFRYDIASRSIWRITNTPEGEFSPAVMPDGRNISVVRVEADGTQRVWRIPASGDTTGESSIILRDIKPVGYYAWIDDRTLALYVLGPPGEPSTLHVADTQTGSSRLVATNIGRSIQRMPSGDVSFVSRQSNTANDSSRAPTLQRLTGFRTEALTGVPSGISEPYVVWLPDGSALVAANTTLYRWRRGETSWTVVANLEAFGLHAVTRLAISPKGDRIAIVASAK